MRSLLFLGLLFGWNSANAADALLTCVNKNGAVTFTKTIRTGELCTPLLKKHNSDFEVPPAEARRAEPGAGTNFVLMCQEIEYSDFRLSDPQWAKARSDLLRHQIGRNERLKRPYFALKYVDNKLSYTQEGNAFLDDDMPDTANDLGWVGRIAIRENSISLELRNTSTELPRMRTLLQVDRYTGLYKALKFAPGKEEADEMETGKCEKYNEKLF